MTGQRGSSRTYFNIVGKIEKIETIAVGAKIRDINHLRLKFGRGRWRKMKGVAEIELESGEVRTAEVHWYEAHGVGRRKMKIKRLID